MKIRHLRPRLLVAAVALAVSTPAWATLMLAADLETLARRSDAIVRGKAVRSVSVATADGQQIQTITTVRVAASLKGGVGETVEVRTPGGTLGDLEQRVAGAPEFEEGQEVVVFLHRASERHFAVEGLGLGKFDVIRDADGEPRVRQRVRGLSVVEPDGRVHAAPELEPVPERDFLDRIRRALATREAP